MSNVTTDLVNNRSGIAIWGLGFLGYTNVIRYSLAGINVVVTEFEESVKRLENFERNGYPAESMKKIYDEAGVCESDFSDVEIIEDCDKVLRRKDIVAHLLCLPKYLSGRGVKETLPNYLKKRLKEIRGNNLTFILEPLLIPGTINQEVIDPMISEGLIINRDLSLAYAPRRDWIAGEDEGNVRICWASSDDCYGIVESVLGLVDHTVHRIDESTTCEVIANLENSLRHVESTILNQLAASYTKVNIRPVVAAINKITQRKLDYPAIGTGGVKVPVSTLNLLNGAPIGEGLTIFRETIFSDFAAFKNVTSIIYEKGARHVGILGLAYRPGEIELGVCPGLEIAEELINSSIKVKVNDSIHQRYLNEISHKIGYFPFPAGLSEFDLLLVVSPLKEYKSIKWSSLKIHVKKTCVIDCVGIWKNFDWSEVDAEYILLGDTKERSLGSRI